MRKYLKTRKELPIRHGKMKYKQLCSIPTVFALSP